MKILDDIPVRLDINKVLSRLHLDKQEGNPGHLKNIRELIKIALSVVVPRAIYEVAYVDNKHEETVDIGGVRFTSRILRTNLDKVDRVFPYIITIGKELEDRVDSFDNVAQQYYLSEIGDVVLGLITRYLEQHLKRTYKLGQVSKMNPGSLSDWPLTQQEQLFSIFGNAEHLIGVKLTDSFLMSPRKSLTGIYFPTKVKFHSCQLCPVEGCEERKVPYNRRLARSLTVNHKGLLI